MIARGFMTAAALEVPSDERLSNKDGLDEILRIFSVSQKSDMSYT
jgi:hypothetical protein